MAVRTSTLIAAFALMLLALELPVITAALPPLIDYPNHLARMHLIAEGGDPFWRVHWGALPNLAEDGFVWLLHSGLPVELAARAFLFLTVAVNAVGMVWLGRVLQGAFRPWSLLALMFLWSASLLWGFLNYSFGLGLAWIAAAAWLAMDRRPLLRAVIAIPIAVAIWFAHIEAFAIYAILIAGFECLPFYRGVRSSLWGEAFVGAALAGLQFILPIALSLFVWSASATQNWEVSNFWRKPDLIFTAFDNYNPPLDILTLIVVFAGFGWMLATRRLTVAPRAIAALALLLVAFLVSPNHLYSGGGADHRLPAVILTLFVAASAAQFRTSREAIGVYGLLFALFFVRLAVLEYSWLGAERTYAKDLALLDQVPPGSAIAVGHRANAIKFSSAPELHMPLMATVRRDAFVSTLFAYPEQQPIAATPRGEALRSATSEGVLWSAFVDRDSAALAQSRSALAGFDYLVLVGLKPFQVQPDAALSLVGETPTFKLFALRKP